METIKIEIIDKLTYETIEEVEVNVDKIRKFVVMTSDPETTNVLVIGHEDEN